jgi:2-hydroxychromene-2-carboxylate isomerase
MMRRVEFMFDFGSPNAYLAETFIPEVERRTERRCARHAERSHPNHVVSA